jgi:hypothetical protein
MKRECIIYFFLFYHGVSLFAQQEEFYVRVARATDWTNPKERKNRSL